METEKKSEVQQEGGGHRVLKPLAALALLFAAALIVNGALSYDVDGWVEVEEIDPLVLDIEDVNINGMELTFNVFYVEDGRIRKVFYGLDIEELPSEPSDSVVVYGRKNYISRQENCPREGSLNPYLWCKTRRVLVIDERFMNRLQELGVELNTKAEDHTSHNNHD